MLNVVEKGPIGNLDVTSGEKVTNEVFEKFHREKILVVYQIIYL